MKPKLSRQLTVLAIVIALLPGCVNAMLMDTARALPSGEGSLTMGIGAGWQPAPITQYSLPVHPDWPASWASPDSSDGSYPPSEFHLEWMARGSYGVGGGGQINLALSAPLPAGLGGVAGLKWQFPLPEQHPFAAAALVNGGFSFGAAQSGAHSGSIITAHAEAGFILSVDVSSTNSIYLGPRVRWDTLHHSLTKEGVTASTDVNAQSYIISLGWAIHPRQNGAYFLEPRLIYTPHLQHDDGVQLAMGFGWSP